MKTVDTTSQDYASSIPLDHFAPDPTLPIVAGYSSLLKDVAIPHPN